MNESTKIIELLESIHGHLSVYTTLLFIAILGFLFYEIIGLISLVRQIKNKKRLSKISKENLNESICKDKDNVND